MGHSPALQDSLRHGVRTTRTCSKCGRAVAEILDRCPHDAAPLLSAEAMARVGMQVGDYELRSVIGEGGTGVVYRGRDVARDKGAAIKVLHDRCARKEDVVEQFIGEARAAGRIRHPNVIDVTDLGTTPDGTVFLAMEYLEGESLRDRLRRVQRLPLFEAINILRQVARGLGAAHEAGIVHGGLKPSNIFLCKREGRRRIVRRSKAKGMRLGVEPELSFDLVKLLDFGIASFLDLSLGAQSHAGGEYGTSHYLSPEQAQMRPADPQSDIYSLGAVFYEMVTGTVPFGGESLPEILREHVSSGVIAPSRRTPGAGIDGRIDALILRCLKKNPALRFASTGELCGALDACVTDCAFLRDAHRLPGIMESGIDLSEASSQARQDPARSTKMPAVAPVLQKPAAAPVVAKPTGAPVLQKPAAAPVVAKPTAAPVLQKPAAAPVVAKPTVAPVLQKPAAAPVVAKPTVAQTTDDPAAAVLTPPPAMVATAKEPAASVSTPPPATVAVDLSAEISARVDDRTSRKILELPEAILSNLGEGPERFDPEADGLPGRAGPASSRRLPPIALAGVLLLGGGIAVWATHSGSTPGTMEPVFATRTTPAPTLAPSPPPLAPAPVSTVTAPAASAAPAPAAALPRQKAAAPVEMAGPAARGPGKLALSRPRPAQASNARRAAPMIPLPPEAAPAPAAESDTAPPPAAESETTAGPAAKPRPQTEPPSPITASAKPEPTPPAPANAEDLVREAQQAWMRGHFAAAISKAQAALEAQPKDAQSVQAYEIIATCSCAIGKTDSARDAAAHLSATKRETVKAVCEKKGVTIE